MKSRIIPHDEIDEICFSHLKYSRGDNDMSWPVAFLIAFPLVLFSVYISRYLFCKAITNFRNGNFYLPAEDKGETSSEGEYTTDEDGGYGR